MAGLNPEDFEDVSPAGGGGFDPSDYEDVREAAPAAPRKDSLGNELKHGAGQTFVRGALDMITFGHHDEISGWIDAALQGHPFDGDVYRRERDKYRAEMAQGKEENPKAHYAGEAAGAVATALAPGGVARSASLGRAALKGAAMGAAAGEGASEGDLTKHEFGRVALDSALGAGVGAVTGAAAQKLGNWMAGAAERTEGRQLAGLKEGVQYSTKLKTFGKATAEAPEGQFTGAVKAALKEQPAIKKAIASEPGKALGLVDAHVNKLTDQLDTIYQKAQDAGPGVPLAKVLRSLHKVEMDFEKTTANKPLAQQVAGVIEQLRDKWQNTNVVKSVGHMPLQTLREEYRVWQDIANKSAKLFSSKSPREEVSEAMANAMREALQAHVETVATRNPSLGISRKLLQDTNAKVSTWLRVQNALTEKVTRQNIAAPPMGQAIMEVVKHPLRTTAQAAVPLLERATDPGLAKLTQLAQGGDARAAAFLRALMNSPGRAGAQQAASAVASTGPSDEPTEALASQ